MASTSTQATMWSCPNFIGPLYTIGANQTPFLNMIGGLTGGRATFVGDFEHPLNVQDTLDAAAQPAIGESTAASGPPVHTFVRATDKNVAQIYQYGVSVTYPKQSVIGNVKGAEYGSSGFSYIDVTQTQAVQNEVNHQIALCLKQAAKDIDYTFLRGSYQLGTTATTAFKTRGICTACTTNTVAAGSVDLSQDLIRELVRTMAGNGSTFTNPVIFVNAFQMQQLSGLYGYAPESRTVGGVSINQIVLDLAGMVGVVWAPSMSTSVLLLADLDKCRPVFLPMPGKGVLFYEDLTHTGAVTKGQIYGQIGIDYAADDFHGTITGLTTS